MSSKIGRTDPEAIRQTVRTTYGAIATGGDDQPGQAGCGSPTGSARSCCTPNNSGIGTSSEKLGYSAEELRTAPDGSVLGLGCGNPTAIAALRPGDVVLDLGSGAGIDCFLAAAKVGPNGTVIGVDMTPEMVERARRNAARSGVKNVDFRLGEIEHLPVADSVVDVIISNCVVNLSPDKPAVFREAARVLKPGGRLSISDIVATAPLPENVKEDVELISGCIAGAAQSNQLREWLEQAGFRDIQITIKEESREFISDWAPGLRPEQYVGSAMIQAIRE